MIVSRDRIRAAFERAMSLCVDEAAAAAAVAQALGISVELVREALAEVAA